MTVDQDHAGVPDAQVRASGAVPVTAPRSTAARLAALEAEVAGQQEQIRQLDERLSLTAHALLAHRRKVAEMTDALMEAFGYAGVHYPVPRHLRAVPDGGGVALDGHGSAR